MKKIILLLILYSIFILKTKSQTLVLNALIYDNTPSRNPDFEASGAIGVQRGLVNSFLGADRTPVYCCGNSPSVTIHSQDTFESWFHNVPGVNLPIQKDIILTQSPSNPNIYSYSNDSYFVIDGQGFDDRTLYPNERIYRDASGKPHNFHFCLQAHTQFQYKTGDVFNFAGDDDVWVFINNLLVVDLGGIHTIASASVNLDLLGLIPGQNYPFDFFYCERHTVESHMRIETSLAFKCPQFDECGVCQGDGSSCCTRNNCDDNPIYKRNCITASCSNNVCITSAPSCPSTDPCTVGLCTTGVGCSIVPKNCTNDNHCTQDSCNPTINACQHDPIPNCVDCAFIGCITTDFCNPQVCSPDGRSCLSNPKNCDDFNFCTTDTCSNGVCIYTRIDNCVNCTGPGIGCITTDQCNPNVCAPDGNSCVIVPKNCSDGDSCNVPSCVSPGGACMLTPLNCDDGDDCTFDSCSPTAGCQHQTISNCVECQNIACITTDFCNVKICINNGTTCDTFPKTCDDGDSCTIDTCISPTGACQHEPIANCVNCGGNQCITTDFCSPLTGCGLDGLTCTIEPKKCDDFDPCTFDSCISPQGDCGHSPITGCVACNEVLGCTTTDPCHPVVCSALGDQCITTDKDCEDGNHCTINDCRNDNGTAICLNSLIINCDDCSGIGCTTTDFCSEQICSLDGNSCLNVPLNCSDNLQCTLDSCVGPMGVCSHIPIAPNCLECALEPCITTDNCQPVVCGPDGHCIQETMEDFCNDYDYCTVDTCTPVGCDHASISGCRNCSNGIGCTTPSDDACNLQVCSDTGDSCVTMVLNCDDNDPCTEDNCLNTGFCQNNPIEGCVTPTPFNSTMAGVTLPPTNPPTTTSTSTGVSQEECDCCPKGQKCLLVNGHEICIKPAITGGIPELTTGCAGTTTGGTTGRATGHYTESGTGNPHLCDRYHCRNGMECHVINGVPECVPSNYKCLDCLDVHCEKQGDFTCFMVKNPNYIPSKHGCYGQSCCKFSPVCKPKGISI
ncbi:hypothetical protein ACTFIU_004289 [Dictyostelium citrinum]